MQTHVPGTMSGTMSEAWSLQGLSGLEKEEAGDSKGPPPSSGRLTEDTDQAQSWEARPQSRPQAKAARPLPADPAPSRLPGSGLSGDTETAPPGSLFQAPQTESPITRRASRSAPPAPKPPASAIVPAPPPAPQDRPLSGAAGLRPRPPGPQTLARGSPDSAARPPPPGGRLDAPDPPGRSPSGPQPLRRPPRPLPGASAAPPPPPRPRRSYREKRGALGRAGPGRARGGSAGDAARLQEMPED